MSGLAGNHLLKKSALVCGKPGSITLRKGAQKFSLLFEDCMICSGWNLSPYRKARWAFINLSACFLLTLERMILCHNLQNPGGFLNLPCAVNPSSKVIVCLVHLLFLNFVVCIFAS